MSPRSARKRDRVAAIGWAMLTLASCSYAVTVPRTITAETELDCSSVYPSIDLGLGVALIASGVLVFHHFSAQCPPDADGEPCSAGLAGFWGATPFVIAGISFIGGATTTGERRLRRCKELEREQLVLRRDLARREARDRATVLMQAAVVAARAGHCDVVAARSRDIRELDVAFYATVFVRDPAIQSCIAPVAPPPAVATPPLEPLEQP